MSEWVSERVSEWESEWESEWVSEWVTITVSAISVLFSSFHALDMLGRYFRCTDSVAAALKLDNILVFSTPKSIIFFFFFIIYSCISFFFSWYFRLLQLEICRRSLLLEQKLSYREGGYRTSPDAHIIRVFYNIFAIAIYALSTLLKLTISLLWHISIYWCWSSRVIMLMMIVLTQPVKSIFVFKSKRAAIVTWSPSLVARKKAFSRFESSTEWRKWV